MRKSYLTIAAIFMFACVIAGIVLFCCRECRISKYQKEWETTRKTIEITVLQGDTIDGYYYQYAPDWMSIYQWRQEILDLNNKTSYTIHAGATILIYI